MNGAMILFRGKCLDTGKWVEGGYAYEPNADYSYITFWNSFGLSYMDSCRVDPATIGQYIRLNDMHGKKAFTGDISKDRHGRLWVILDCPGGFGTCPVSEWVNRDSAPCILYHGLSEQQNAFWFTENHEVIGNIFDNAELLEGGTKK